MTFRTVQAIVDHKNYGKLSFVEFTIFLLLPTSLLAGPIDRSYRLKKDLDLNYKNLNLRNFLKAWEILILGVLFKFIIAYAINKFWLMKINVNSTNFTTIANSAYAYSTYLFFDFSGYSAMAVGFSRILGINMPRNFNHPFLAQNPQDFWRRFHITLGTWLTDYFFKPSYKSLLKVNFFKKKRLLAQNLAITATFIFMGFWNGFTWYYICSGLLFGLASSLHNSYLSYIKVGGFDYFELLPNILKINLKRFLMLHTAILALYIFSGRVPL